MTLKRRGIILAGGTGTRLYPATISVSKQLMPVFDKPMIYYPLSVLMEASIDEVLIITTPQDNAAFQHLLKNGSQLGMRIDYAVQPNPDGLAQALIIAEDFLSGGPSALILGDNLFFGQQFRQALHSAAAREKGATIFGYHVKNPSDYGVVGFDADGKAASLDEKPDVPASNYAVTGLYFYDADAPALAKSIAPSARGELEITSLNALYMDRGDLSVERLERGSTWLDTGTPRSLLQAAQFVGIIDERQGRRICCPEEIAWRKGWIDDGQLLNLAQPLEKSGYGQYLLNLI
jgi:glucose-1-phosphate thymidylyltransferase